MASVREQRNGDLRASSLSLNLSSNNPFRTRAASPGPQSPGSPLDDPFSQPQKARPVSRNPFLDPAITAKSSLPNLSEMASGKMSPTIEELFDSVTLGDSQAPLLAPGETKGTWPTGPDMASARMGGRAPPPGSQPRVPPSPNKRRPAPGPPGTRQENVRPPGGPRGPMPPHRQSGSNGGGGPPARSSVGPPASRVRRNSESSVRDSSTLPRPTSVSRRRPKPRKKTDIIDLMDHTNPLGMTMHHDGPYDALNKHRNKTGSSRAPMLAFPKDSLNNVLGGSGPLNVRPDHSALMGNHDDEAFKEWSKVDRGAPGAIFDAKGQATVLYGDETMGLGTTTFLEGTPATRAAVQKAEEERSMAPEAMQRKKSIAQRIRGVRSRPYQESANGGGFRSPDLEGYSGMSARSSGGRDSNPFDEMGKGEEGFSVRVLDSNRQDRPGGGPLKTPTSPPPAGLERRPTADGVLTLGNGSPEQDGGNRPSFMTRMRSMSTRNKGRRPTIGADSAPAPAQDTAPGDSADGPGPLI